MAVSAIRCGSAGVGVAPTRSGVTTGFAGRRAGKATPGAKTSALLLAALACCGDDLAPEQPTVSVRWSVPALQLREGEQARVELSLEAPPAKTLLLSLRPPAHLTLQAGNEALRFTKEDYAIPRQVFVQAMQDDDAADERDALVIEQTGQGVDIEIADDDELSVLFDQRSVSLSEAGTAEIGVRLAAKPPAELSISLRATNPTALLVDRAELVFTPETWDVPQRVVLSGATDLDGDDEWLELRASGASERALSVQIIDRERQAILSNVSSVSMNEGFSRVVMMNLRTAPRTPVTVNLAVTDQSLATVTPSALSFNATNYASPQRVTIQSLSDLDMVNGATMLTATAAGILSHSVAIDVIDQTALGLAMTPSFYSLAEGSTTELSLRLTAMPPAATTVSCSLDDPSALAIQPQTLIFQPATWNVAQTITVTALQDPDNVDELSSVDCSAPPAATKSVGISVFDDEPRFCGDGVCTVEEWMSCMCDLDCAELGCPESAAR